MAFTLTFIQLFALTTYLVSPILITLSLLIIGIGQMVGKLEGWRRFDTFYWTLITATTVGYGDIRPKHHVARILSIVIAILGVIFTGILVSIAIEATSHTIAQMGTLEAYPEFYQQTSPNKPALP